MQVFKLDQADGGFKSLDLKVSFHSIFKSCLAKVRAGKKTRNAPAPDETVMPVDKSCRVEGVVTNNVEVAEVLPPTSSPNTRKVGPQLPLPGIGAVGCDGSSTEEEGNENEAGPKMAGEERDGIDLNAMPRQQSVREEWMTTPHASMAGAFADCPGPLKKADKFEVKRSDKDREAFERAFKEARGPSLLEEQRNNKFAGREEEMEKMRKLKSGTSDIWGMSVGMQARGGAEGVQPTAASRKAFDPERDLKSTKQMSSDEFNSLVQNSASGLGRFHRGQVATSFL